MNRAIEWFAKNSVAANLLMMMVLAAGLFSAFQMKQEVFPEFSLDIISVSVPYLGAAPEEVEEGVCVKIEEALQGVDGIKKVTSSASEGAGSVIVEVLAGYDARKLLDDVKARVDAIDTFPEQTEKPVVQELLLRNQVINIAVSGQTDERTLKNIAEQVRDDILDLPGISQAEIAAARPFEISIEVSEHTLRQYNLTFDEVVLAVRRSSLDLPGGAIKAANGEILLRTKGQAYRGGEFENIILRSLPDGTRLLLGDVANIVDGFAETDMSARFNDEPAVIVQVFRVGEENARDVAKAVKGYLVGAHMKVPEGIKLTTWQDDTRILDSRLSLMVRNGMQGLVLVFFSLALFLRFRLAMWVGVGLVVSFLGAFWMMPYFGVSINLMSLFAFVVVLGIVVDDAIVVGENIYTHIESGKRGVLASVDGAKQVGIPVTFAVLTTVAAFSPLLAVPGIMGKFLRVVPIIVVSTLIFSLLESLLVLPSHLRHVNPKPSKENDNGQGFSDKWRRFQGKFAESLRKFANTRYRSFLGKALRNRYTSLATGIAVFFVTVGLVAGGWVNFVFLPNIESDNVVAILTMPQGASVESTTRAARLIEQSAVQLIDEFKEEGDNPIEHMLVTVGDQPFRQRQNQRPGGVLATFNQPNLAEINLQLFPSEERTVTSNEIARRWRELTPAIPDVEELSFTASLFSAGEAINIQLNGANYQQLLVASEELKAKLAEYAGVFDISDSFLEGKEEIKLKVKPEAESFGVTLADLARQVRQAFYGEEAQRIQRGRDDIRVMIRYPESERRTVGDLEDMRIRVASGGEVPFSVAADVEIGRGYSSISRTDRKRTVSVTADVDESEGNANQIIADVVANYLPGLLDKYPTVNFSMEGEQKEQAEALGGLQNGFYFALLLIYILLAIPFRSYSQPFIVMSAIPFGLVGAILGHIILGLDVSFMSLFGIVALTGVVVNDSLVMVDFVNKARRSSLSLPEAIREAGVARFRPIILTSLTTFLGLTPLLLEKSVQAQFLIPMAVSLAFGVLFATLITLILVPVIYYILEDAKAGVHKLLPAKLKARNALLDSGESQAALPEQSAA